MNTKLTNILLILLLVFNVTFLGKWWMGHRQFHHAKKAISPETTALLNDRDKGEMFLVKALGFDTLQQRKLDNVLAVHFSFLDKYMNAYVRNQTNLFASLKDNKDSTYAFRCADSMGMLKVAMERELYLNFISIKNICSTGQQEQFNELISNVSKEFVHHHDLHKSEKADKDSL